MLVDGDFFLRGVKLAYGPKSPSETADLVLRHAKRHLIHEKRDPRSLYRIFFYDCPPLKKKLHNPVTHAAIDLTKTPTFEFRTELHQELVRRRKVALRLGEIVDTGLGWKLRPNTFKRLLKGELAVENLSDKDVTYETRQKAVDMRIGLDIASLAFKHQVDQIILVAGDSDFVPAAKLARREGIDFILDSMRVKIRPDLFEHIDGLHSVCPRKDAGRAP